MEVKMKKYIPKRGDVVWLSLNPTKGHEQAGRRPVLVISSTEYNALLGLALVVPITTKAKGYHTEVPIVVDGRSGVILSDHVRSVAYAERAAEFLMAAPLEIVESVVGRLRAII